jgi:RNA polymerase sigma-70 factor, ECF subfamily
MTKQQLFLDEFHPQLGALKVSALRLTFFNQVNAEELVYLTVEKVLINIDQYQPGTNALAYMRRILLNLFLNQCKQKKTRATKSMPEEDMIRIDSAEDLDFIGNFAELLAGGEAFGDEIVNAFERIRNEEHFHVFAMAMDSYMFREIAEMLDMNENTAKGIVRRIKEEKLVPALEVFAKSFGIKRVKE